MTGKSNCYCQTCKRWDTPLMKNSRFKSKFGCTQMYMCRECNNNRGRKYYKKNTQRCKEIIAKSIKKHPHKQAARDALNYAVRTGRLVKPDECSMCKGSDLRIEGHHHDYEKPLDVTWLCTGCHGDSDKSTQV